jgi:hypothetical protein
MQAIFRGEQPSELTAMPTDLPTTPRGEPMQACANSAKAVQTQQG